MLIETSDIINAPVAKVYALVRDDLPKLAEFLPNIRKIETVNRQDRAPSHEVVNHWYAKAELPGMVKRFLSEDLFAWKDVATWSDERHEVVYAIESFVANDLFEAKGRNEFREASDGEKTELRMSCDIIIRADKVPGVPKLLVKKVVPVVEGVIEKMLGPNLSTLGKGLQEYFQQQSGKA